MVSIAIFFTWLFWRLRYIHYPVLIVLVFYVVGVVLGYDGFWLANLNFEPDVEKLKRDQCTKIRLIVLIEALESVRMLQGKEFEPVLEYILQQLVKAQKSTDNPVKDFTLEEFHLFITKLDFKELNLNVESKQVLTNILEELSRMKWVYWNNPPLDEILYFLKGSAPIKDEKKENLIKLLNNLRYVKSDQHELVTKDKITANCDNFDVNLSEFDVSHNYDLAALQPSTCELLSSNPDICFYLCCGVGIIIYVLYFLELFECFLFKSYPSLYKFLFYS